MQKVIGIPNSDSYHNKLKELNDLLEKGWKVINVTPLEKTYYYSSGVMYTIELKDNNTYKGCGRMYGIPC